MNAPRATKQGVSGVALLFWSTLATCGVAAIFGLSAPDTFVEVAGVLTTTAFRALDWFFMVTVTGFLVLSVYLALSRYGQVRLGTGKPDFSTMSWLAMLFAAGMGTGLVFWGAAEPLTHLGGAPGVEPLTGSAARNSLLITMFHWGFHAWGVYCIAALVLAYFRAHHGASYLPGEPIRIAFKGRWRIPGGAIADYVAVVAVALGVAGSIAMGVQQVRMGLSVIADTDPNSNVIGFVILGLMVVSYTISASTGLERGIKWLSNTNMAIAFLLLAFMLLVGPTSFSMRTMTTAAGDYLTNIVSLSFEVYPWDAQESWFDGWTLTYFIWWIAWAPFVGVFIARISEGRTLRQFVAGVLAAPTGFTLVWFGVFGGTAIHEQLRGGGGMTELVREDVTTALFLLFERFPASGLLSITAIVLVFVFLVTSVDSATFVLGMLTSGGSLNPPGHRKVTWGIVIAALGTALFIAGGYDVIRAGAVLGAIPFTLIMLLQAAALMRSLRLRRAKAAEADDATD